jgi:hypothetical protein
VRFQIPTGSIQSRVANSIVDQNMVCSIISTKASAIQKKGNQNFLRKLQTFKEAVTSALQQQ